MNEQPVVDPKVPCILSLTEEARFAPNGIVSRTLLSTPHSRVVLFGFAAHQELTEHTTTQHAMVQVLSGECDFSLDGTWHRLTPGQLLYMPPNLRHAVKSRGEFSMLLTLVKPAAPVGMPPALNLVAPMNAP